MNDRTKRLLMGVLSTMGLVGFIGTVMGVVGLLCRWAYMKGYYGG